jgi:hypothetical protein
LSSLLSPTNRYTVDTLARRTTYQCVNDLNSSHLKQPRSRKLRHIVVAVIMSCYDCRRHCCAVPIMALIVSHRGRRLVVVASQCCVTSRLRSDAPAREIFGRLAKVLASLSMYGTSSRSRPARRGVPVEHSRVYLLTITSPELVLVHRPHCRSDPSSRSRYCEGPSKDVAAIDDVYKF